MDREDILTILKNQDAPVSGEEISKKLNVSRAAVWKGIEALREEGYIISSAPRRGYKLEEKADLLKSGEIAAMTEGCFIGKRIICLDTVDSTNNECKRLSITEDAAGTIITSEEQTAGKGRRGHSFSSPKGKGLYLSAVLKPDVAPAEVSNITCWVGVAACNAVEEISGMRPAIKWTNDLVLNNKKLCGILTELELEAESGEIKCVIAGIGINCNHSPLDFPEEIRSMATSIAIESGKDIHRADLAAALIRQLNKLNSEFPKEKEAWLNRYRKDCCTLGKDVKIIYPGGATEEGFAEDITEDFELIVKLKDGTRKTVSSGDVSVRGLYGYA